MITQSIGGRSYSLRPTPVTPWPKAIMKNVISVLSIPIFVPFMFFQSVLMATPFRDTLLSLFLPKIMTQIGKEFKEERKTLLSGAITPDSVVLDLGSGGGAYLPYCTEAKEVVAVEPIETMYPQIRESGKGIKNLTIYRDISDIKFQESGKAGEGSDSGGNEDHPLFDVVILGNVLCEVPDIAKTLQQVDERLAPGGIVYFSEHVGRPVGTWPRWCQDRLNPMWCHMMGGCNCNRDSVDMIRHVHGWTAISWTYEHVRACMGNFVLGLAIKEGGKSQIDSSQ